MNRALIVQDYLDNIKLLQKYNKNYYGKDNPIVSDQEFDLLKKN